MNTPLSQVLSSLRRFQPVPWDRIPDLGLYMDQVITFVAQVYEPLYGPEARSRLTSSMINNYVKAKLIPRPTGKKYSRDQIAQLIMIVALKQVASMEEIRAMMTEEPSVEALYAQFCARQTAALALLSENSGETENPAMHFAILASACQAGCEAVLSQPPNQSDNSEHIIP